jgi:hypothetical protein
VENHRLQRCVRGRPGASAASAEPRPGAVKLLGVGRDEGVAGCGVVLIGVVSASRGKADYVVPGSEAGGHFLAVGIGVQPVASGSEVR